MEGYLQQKQQYKIFYFFVIPIHKSIKYKKMDLTSIEGYKNASVISLKNKHGDLWVIMKDVKDGLGVRNISDLILKDIYGVYKKKYLTQEEIKYYKMTEREFFKTFYDYDEDSLNTKSNKTIFVKNTMMTNIIKNCKGEKKEV